MASNYYILFQVPEDASLEDIHEAYVDTVRVAIPSGLSDAGHLGS
jgi:hypothetical protein